MNWAALAPYAVRALGAFLAIFLTGMQGGQKPGQAAIAGGIGAVTQLYPSVKQPQP